MDQGQADHLDLIRQEIKFQVPGDLKAIIKSYLASHCILDPHNKHIDRYQVRTLYLDSPDRMFLEQKRRNLPVRTKLRVRTYPADLKERVYLEVKERSPQASYKKRISLERGEWECLLPHFRSNKIELKSSMHQFVLNAFHFYVGRYDCGPVMLISYEREAYLGMSPGYARITFDTNIRYQRCTDWSLTGGREDWYRLDLPLMQPSVSVLEMKFEGNMPLWMGHLISELDLKPTSFSKYLKAHTSVEDLNLISHRKMRVVGEHV